MQKLVEPFVWDPEDDGYILDARNMLLRVWPAEDGSAEWSVDLGDFGDLDFEMGSAPTIELAKAAALHAAVVVTEQLLGRLKASVGQDLDAVRDQRDAALARVKEPVT